MTEARDVIARVLSATDREFVSDSWEEETDEAKAFYLTTADRALAALVGAGLAVVPPGERLTAEEREACRIGSLSIDNWWAITNNMPKPTDWMMMTVGQLDRAQAVLRALAAGEQP